jgi:cell wall-associated NlpC family hydrolase
VASATTADATGAALVGVPDAYRPWIYRASRQCTHRELSPSLLAAQLYEESGFRADAHSPAGAEGPAQFMPGTWATWGRDDDGNGTASPYDVGDAVMAQGRFMCSLLGQALTSGFPADPRGLALAGYNAGWEAVERAHGIPPIPETQAYVADILAGVPRFQGTTAALQVAGRGVGPAAVRKALTQLGVNYSFGGGSPAGPSTGFCDSENGYLHGACAAATTVGWDCSSLVQYAYWPTRQLPRTAAEQYAATADHPVARADLQPGDLVFWRHRDGGIYHVALYAGGSQMVEAPKTGDVVKRAPLDAMPPTDYAGATRP